MGEQGISRDEIDEEFSQSTAQQFEIGQLIFSNRNHTRNCFENISGAQLFESAYEDTRSKGGGSTNLLVIFSTINSD
jgi:hypothetical protein